MVKHCPNMNLVFLEILKLNSFIKNYTFTIDLGDTVSGNMSVMTMGIFHVFHIHDDFDMCFASNTYLFTK